MNSNGSEWIRPEKRLAIYLRDEFRCAYCNGNLHAARPDQVTLDHLQPRFFGGNNDHTNLVTACRSCNSKRGAIDIFVFADHDALVRISGRVKRPLPLELAKAIASDDAIPSRDATEAADEKINPAVMLTQVEGE